MQPAPEDHTNDNVKLVPGHVRQLLANGEEVEVRYEMKGAEAFATPTRLIILRGGQTSSHDYKKIAGTREITRTNVWFILCGVALFALGGTSTIFPVAGAVLVLIGVLTRARRVEVLVTGLKEPIVLDGTREVLGPLVQRLTERGARRLAA